MTAPDGLLLQDFPLIESGAETDPVLVADLQAQAADLRKEVASLKDHIEQATKLTAATKQFSEQRAAVSAAATRHVQQTGAAQDAKAVRDLSEADGRLAATFTGIQETAVKMRSASGARALAVASSIGSYANAEEQFLEELTANTLPAADLRPGLQVSFC